MMIIEATVINVAEVCESRETVSMDIIDNERLLLFHSCFLESI